MMMSSFRLIYLYKETWMDYKRLYTNFTSCWIIKLQKKHKESN